MGSLSYVLRSRGSRPRADLTLTSPEAADRVRAFHAGLPGYAPTPLADLKELAARLGVARLWVKDESQRFGLNAFKALGGSYAIAMELARRLGRPLEELSFDDLCGPEAQEKLGKLTFVTATDGNHGRGGLGCPEAGPQLRGLHAQRERTGAAGEHPGPGG